MTEQPRTFDATKIHDTVFETVQAICIESARKALGPDAPDQEVLDQAGMFHAFLIGWPSPSSQYH